MSPKHQGVPQVGHYSNVVLKTLFGYAASFVCSGQKPLIDDPTAPGGFRVCDGGIKEQTAQTLQNIETMLKQKGLSLRDVTRMQVFLADLNDFDAFNEAYAAHLGDHKPARAVVGASIRYGAKLEIMPEGQCSLRFNVKRLLQKLTFR